MGDLIISELSNKRKNVLMGTEVRYLGLSTSLDNNGYEIEIPESSAHLTVTTVLEYCKVKILNPYLSFLSFVGLRPWVCEQLESSYSLKLLTHVYTCLVVILLFLGYILQYMSCFRRDRGFCYIIKNENFLLEQSFDAIYQQTCDGSLFFSFVIPSILHLAGYLYAIIVNRTSDDEQIPILMERVFLITKYVSNSFIEQKKIVRLLWIFVLCSIIWMLSSFALVIYMMADGEIQFKWSEHCSYEGLIFMKFLLVIGTLWHDIVQATIISSYCLQAQLLTCYVIFLREKLLSHTIQPLEWIREMEDFKKLLTYFNDRIAPSVCLLTLLNLSYTFSGMLWIFHMDKIDCETMPLISMSVLNLILWIIISAVPFVQASKLSNVCEILRTVGQEVRARPYVHVDTPTIELDSLLLYTSSLKINARLYLVPITGKKICFFASLAAIVILVLGQCHYLNLK